MNDYLTRLNTLATVDRWSDEELAARQVLSAARMGSQSAYDAIVEFYLSADPYPKNFADPENRPLILPSAAMLAITDKGSKFSDEKLFSSALQRFIRNRAPMAEAIGLKWCPRENLDEIDYSFLQNYEVFLAPLLPRLIFKNADNDGFDDLVTSYDSDECPANSLSLILFLGMSFLSRHRVNTVQIFFPDSYLRPLLFYDLSRERIEDVAKKFASEELAYTQLQYPSELQLKTNDEECSEEYLEAHVLKCFWQVAIMKQILETSLRCAENNSYGGERKFFDFMQITFSTEHTPLELTYVGKHILGSLIATFEVMKDILDAFEIDKMTALNGEIRRTVDRLCDVGYSHRSEMKVYCYHDEIIDSVELGKRLLEKFPVIEHYKRSYLDMKLEPFWYKEKWEVN